MRRQLVFAAAALLAVILAVPLVHAINDRVPGHESAQSPQAVTALGNAFSYQGRLTEGGAPANATYDFRFMLFDADTAGAQVGDTVDRNDLPVTQGLFSTDLDFGAGTFTGDAAWLEIAVRPGASTGNYTVLTPRQPIQPVPYALYAKAAGVALPFAGTGSTPTDPLFGITQSGAGIGIGSTAATGTAGHFSGATGLVVIGTTLALDVTGDVEVDGQVSRTFGGELSPAGPIAYGHVNGAGSLETSTANITAAERISEGLYELTIDGVEMTEVDFVVLVTLEGNVGFVTWGAAADGDLEISTFDMGGTENDAAFSVAVFQP